MEKVWEIKSPPRHPKPARTSPSRETAPRIEKDPARAYTLSLLFWGAGQGYNEEHGKALAFQILLVAVIVNVVLAGLFFNRLVLFLQSARISLSASFLAAEILIFSILVFWFSNAGDAYRAAARSRSNPFRGFDSRFYPCFCSLLLPGWGQFLNGQPAKGSLFSAVSVFGLFAALSIPAALLAWPSLDESDARFTAEAVFAVTTLYSPLVPFFWLFSGYDALKVSLDELKKESLWERIVSANNRRRTQGWVRGIFPQVRSTLLLVLFLVFLVLVIDRVFPSGFYAGLLSALSAGLRARGMTILPEIIELAIPAVGRFGGRI